MSRSLASLIQGLTQSSSDCEMGDTADDKCKESKNAAYNFLYLESARNYWMYLQSFMKAIVDARSYISGQIPSMFDDFGDPVSTLR